MKSKNRPIFKISGLDYTNKISSEYGRENAIKTLPNKISRLAIVNSIIMSKMIHKKSWFFISKWLAMRNLDNEYQTIPFPSAFL